MEYSYSFVDYTELRDKLQSAGETLNNTEIWNSDVVEALYAYCCSDGDKVVGVCVGTVYKPGTISRHWQWNFGENKKRELWIDSLFTNPHSKCKGSTMLAAVEDKLRQHINSVQRKNIYIASVFPAVGFYEVCGYREIITPEDKVEDEDYPFVFRSEHLKWMCKGLKGDIEDEELYEVGEWIFWDAVDNHSIKSIQPYLKFTIGIDFLLFFDQRLRDLCERGEREFFDRFKRCSGRMFLDIDTNEEFRKRYYAKYEPFLDSLVSYKEDRTDKRVFEYFTKDEETVKAILEATLEDL